MAEQTMCQWLDSFAGGKAGVCICMAGMGQAMNGNKNNDNNKKYIKKNILTKYNIYNMMY